MSEITLEMEQALDAWTEKYLPIQNHLVTEAPWNGTMFETYGEEYAYVAAQPPQNVWTWMDGDTGSWIVNGLFFVNRIGYFITENPCELDIVEIQTDIYGDNE
jgi:hypothetical protein